MGSDRITSSESARWLFAENFSTSFALWVGTAGFILTIATFYPGFLSDDALDQFGQALSFRFDDWHPPAMALLWSAIDHVWIGAQPMLLLQAGLYWGSVFFLLRAIPRPDNRYLRWAIIASLFSPAILNFLGVIEEDTQLATCWVFVAARCYYRRSAGSEPSRVEKAILLILTAYGAVLRQNSAFVAGPLVLYLLVGRIVMTRVWQTAAVYLTVLIGCAVATAAMNHAIDATPRHAIRGLMNFDLAGMTLRSGENVFPFTINADEVTRLAACYGDGISHDKLIWGDCSFVWNRGMSAPLTDAGYVETWLRTIARHPISYVAHRLTFFARFGGLVSLQPTHAFWNDGSAPNTYGFVVHRHALFYLLKGAVYGALATPFLRVGFWLVAGCVLIWLARRHRRIDGPRRRFVEMTGVVSVLYLLTYLPFGVAPDFRYAYPAILLTTFGLCAQTLTLRAVWLAAIARISATRLSGWRQRAEKTGLSA